MNESQKMSDARYGSVVEDARRMLAARLAESGGDPDALDESVPFVDAGIDSLDLVVVLTHFEQQYGMSFENEEVDIEFYPDLGTLAKAITARLPD